MRPESIFEIYGLIAILCLIAFLPRLLYCVPAFRKAKHYVNSKKSRLAVLVPARNESSVIRALLNSLVNQTYDPNFFDTFVIVQSPDDPTCQIASEYQNTYLKVVRDQTCKGDALDGCLRDLLKEANEKYDGYIVVDADNVVTKNFVEEMNNALASGRQIILGKREVKNWQMKDKKYRSWATNCNGMIYTILDKMGNVFRSKHGISCTMCGTGVMVRSDVIEQLGGWPYRTQTEDLEMTVDALLKDWTSLYYEHAVTYTEEALTLKESNQRRVRWLRGYMQIMFKYRRAVFAKMFESLKASDENGNLLPLVTRIKNIRIKNIDYLYSLLPAIIWIIDTIVFFLIYMWLFLMQGVRDGFWDWKCFMFGIDTLMIAYAALLIYTIIVMLVDRKALKISFKEKVVLLFMHPIFIAHYLDLFVLAFLESAGIVKSKNQNVWRPIERIE